MLAGAVYASITTASLRWGWFSGPSSVIGLIAGPGLILHQRWARIPGMVVFAYWFGLGIFFLVSGSSARLWLPLVLSAVGAMPILWKWSDDATFFERV